MSYYSGFDLCHYCVECCQHNEGEVWPYYEIKQNQWPNEELQRLYVGTYIDEANKVSKDFSLPLLVLTKKLASDKNDAMVDNRFEIYDYRK